MPIAWCVPELPPNGAQRITATFQYCQAALWPAGPPHRGAPWFGLSRVKGNFHARFLGGRERVTARAYPTPPKQPQSEIAPLRIYGLAPFEKPAPLFTNLRK